ncbi:MAG: shikimate kinase [Candidatus Gastranaerophilales bacterium]|nr:shikimate kinase [Candidatus Gastranaerophilales bacterium]
MEKNIVLVGMMGSGKTTVANSISAYSDYAFIDIDKEIVNLENQSINDIFADKEKGEKYFRDMETKIAKKIISYKHLGKFVISTGGGILERDENLEILKKNGVVFYLKTDVDELLKRLEGDTSRPLLNGENLKKKLLMLIEKREQNYKNANYIIETSGKEVSQIVVEILGIMNARIKS